jgi:hypothetical protein
VQVNDDGQVSSLCALASAAELAGIPRPNQLSIATMQQRVITRPDMRPAASAGEPVGTFASCADLTPPSHGDTVKQLHVPECPVMTHQLMIANSSGGSSSAGNQVSAPPLTCSCPTVVERRMLVQVNREWERLFGYSASELSNLPNSAHMLLLLYAEESVPTVLERYAESILYSLSDFSARVTIRTKFGTNVKCVRRTHLTLSTDGDICSTVDTFLPVQ